MDFIHRVIQKAQEDNSFRKQLINDPNETLAKYFDENSYDKSLSIKIIDLDEIDLVIVLPKSLSDEMSDDDLDNISGGLNSGQNHSLPPGGLDQIKHMQQKGFEYISLDNGISYSWIRKL